jgi:hypothetical protein
VDLDKSRLTGHAWDPGVGWCGDVGKVKARANEGARCSPADVCRSRFCYRLLGPKWQERRNSEGTRTAPPRLSWAGRLPLGLHLTPPGLRSAVELAAGESRPSGIVLLSGMPRAAYGLVFASFGRQQAGSKCARHRNRRLDNSDAGAGNQGPNRGVSNKERAARRTARSVSSWRRLDYSSDSITGKNSWQAWAQA